MALSGGSLRQYMDEDLPFKKSLVTHTKLSHSYRAAAGILLPIKCASERTWVPGASEIREMTVVMLPSSLSPAMRGVIRVLCLCTCRVPFLPSLAWIRMECGGSRHLHLRGLV